MPNITNITPPRVPLTDPRTGLIAREWYLFFLSLYNQTGSSTTSLEDIQKSPPALTVDELTALINQTIDFLSPGPETSELQASLENVRQELQLLPRLELGTMSQLQQDNLPWVTFDTTPEVVPVTTTGTLYWNTDDNAKTLNLVMEDTGDIVQQIGEETFYRIKADSDITKGQVVMFTGTVGASGGLKAAPATGLTATQNEYIMGVAAQDIILNSWGYITWFGEIRKVNTTGSLYGETWVDGEILYYNPSIAGGLTKTVPAAPNPKVIVAAVVHAATNGVLFVRPTFGSALGATDSNVQITSLANGDLLQYNSANLRWENVPASTLPVGTATNLAGGAANRIPYQTAPSTTSFIVAPTVANTFLNWSGSAFQWSLNPLGTVTSVGVSGGTTGLTFSGGPITTSGTITMAGTLAVVNGGTGAITAAGAATNLGLGTGDSPQFAAVNIGNATDTTITRVSAGVIAVEGKTVVTETGGQTVQFAAGSNTAPSITTTGDTNTGIYFPAADTIATTTGGAERMRIRSDGNIGIGGAGNAVRSILISKAITGGTTAGSLQISTNIASDVTSGANGVGTFLGTDASAFTLTALSHFSANQGTIGAGSTVSAQYGFISSSLNIGATTNIGFYAQDTAAVTAGKTAYGFRSDINTATGGGTTWGFYASGTAANYFAGQVQLGSGSAGTPSLSAFGDTNTGMWYPAADTIAWATGGSERMRIDSSGNVGIGGSPSQKLDVYKGTVNSAIAQFTGNNSGRGLLISTAATAFADDTVKLDAQMASNGVMVLATGGTERVRVDASGNVGIGTSTFGTSAATVLAIATGTAPSTGPADTIQIFSTDLSAGNTILSLRTEGTPVNANTTAAATHRIAVRINGTVYYLLANTAA